MTYPQIEAVSKLHGITPIELLSFDESVFFHNCEQAHAFGQNNTYNGSSLLDRNIFEARVKELSDEVIFLREEVVFLRSQLQHVKNS